MLTMEVLLIIQELFMTLMSLVKLYYLYIFFTADNVLHFLKGQMYENLQTDFNNYKL